MLSENSCNNFLKSYNNFRTEAMLLACKIKLPSFAKLCIHIINSKTYRDALKKLSAKKKSFLQYAFTKRSD